MELHWTCLKEKVKCTAETSAVDGALEGLPEQLTSLLSNQFHCNPIHHISSSNIFWACDIRLVFPHLSCKCFPHRWQDASKHTVPISHRTEQRCFGSSIKDLAVTNVRAQGYTTSCSGFKKLLNMSFMPPQSFGSRPTAQILPGPSFCSVTIFTSCGTYWHCSSHSSTTSTLLVPLQGL